MQFDATPDTAPPPAYSSPQDDTTVLEDTTAVSYPEHDEPSHHEPESTQATQATAFAAPAAAVAGSVRSAATETYEELKERLAKAEATAASLKNELASGLRQRKPGNRSDDSSSAGQPKLAQAERQSSRGTEGVPVGIVAFLCLVSFLLGYIFF